METFGIKNSFVKLPFVIYRYRSEIGLILFSIRKIVFSKVKGFVNWTECIFVQY